MQRNLIEQGGWLDEVHFVRNTEKEEDLEYLHALVDANPRYRILEIDEEKGRDDRYSASWELLQPDAIYVKIDDDVVFVADDTIPRLVTRKMQEPNLLGVSANLINNPLMSKVHYDHGAYYPYLPTYVGDELHAEYKSQGKRDSQSNRTVSWRHTHHPAWVGPDDVKLNQDEPTTGLSPTWLRMSDSQDILRTPVSNVTYDTWGPGCQSWSVAAQSHLSLFENLLNDNTQVYYQNLTDIWYTDYRRLSINFIAINSNEILSYLPVDKGYVDEEWLTVVLPKRIGKHIAVETRALAAHFSFSFQNAIEYTDLLDRYTNFAMEKVCLTPEMFGKPIFEQQVNAAFMDLPTVTYGSSLYGSGKEEECVDSDGNWYACLIEPTIE